METTIIMGYILGLYKDNVHAAAFMEPKSEARRSLEAKGEKKNNTRAKSTGIEL